MVVTRKADGGSHAPVASDDGRVAFVSAATNLSPHWTHNGFDQVYEWREDADGESIVQLSVHDYRGQADANTFQPAISANGAVVAFTSPATALTAAGARGITNVYAHTWIGGVCIAVLVSAADLTAGPWRPPATDQDDDDRCEDRSTAYLLQRAESVHRMLHPEWVQDRRTTAAVRARDQSGGCVIVFAAQPDLTLQQKGALLPPTEVAATSRPGKHAEETALIYIMSKGWQPLALGIAPPQRPICPDCQAFIQSPEGGNGTVVSAREAVWP